VHIQGDPSHDAFWSSLAELPADADLPAELPQRFYTNAHSYIKGAQYADRLADWARHLPPEK
jgi:hypothetical protein